MNRSFGTDAVLEESWTTPWLDDSVFPYWPEAAIIGDLEEFLRWLAVQDGQRTALVLRHPREFEKVHRLITNELVRIKHEAPHGDRLKGIAEPDGSPVPTTAANQLVCVGSEMEKESNNRSQGTKASCCIRPRQAATTAARAQSAEAGDGASAASTASNWPRSWSPSSSMRRAEGGHLSGQHGISAVVPPGLKSSRSAFVSSAARADPSAPANTSSSRPRSPLVTPQPKGTPRRWSSSNLNATGVANNGSSGLGEIEIGDNGQGGVIHGHARVSRVGRGQVTWAANTSAAAAASEAGRRAGQIANLRWQTPTEVATCDQVLDEENIGHAAENLVHHSRGKARVSLRSSLPPSRAASLGDSNSGRDRRHPQPQQSRLSRDGFDEFGGEDSVASPPQQQLEDAFNSSGSDRNCNPDGHTATNPRTPPEMRRSAATEKRVKIRRAHTLLADVDEENKMLHDQVEEAGDEWLCMRDPISLREFWFDPRTGAAEWEGGEAIEGTPGGVGLGLLSEDEREQLKRKIEWRRRRGRRVSTSAAAANPAAVIGAGRGVSVRQQVLRNLTLRASSERDGAGVPPPALGIPRGGSGGAFFSDSASISRSITGTRH